MKIEVPFELGDPIIVVEFNQHDGYYIEYEGFDYTHLSRMDEIFRTYSEAKAYINMKNNNVSSPRLKPGARGNASPD